MNRVILGVEITPEMERHIAGRSALTPTEEDWVKRWKRNVQIDAQSPTISEIRSALHAAGIEAIVQRNPHKSKGISRYSGYQFAYIKPECGAWTKSDMDRIVSALRDLTDVADYLIEPLRLNESIYQFSTGFFMRYLKSSRRQAVAA